MGGTNQDTPVFWLEILEIGKAANETRGQKLDACTMVPINKLRISMQTVQYTLCTLIIISSLIHVYYTTSTYGYDYVVPNMRHLACHHRIHTGEHNMYTMWVYYSCLPLSRHMRLHTAHSLTGCMPFECTICDYKILITPDTIGMFNIVKNIKRWTSWDYSHLLINVHYAGKKTLVLALIM